MARKPILERRIQEILWQGKTWSVREMLDALEEPLAYTTIATVLDRLHKKGLAIRHKDGGSWRYQASASRTETLAAEVSHILQRAQVTSEPMLVAFLDQVEEVDPNALDKLAALIEQRRRER